MLSFKNIFRIVALLEGVSYILLLFVATPIKYLMNDPQYVKLLGMPHGILFIAYIAISIIIKTDYQWNNKQFLTVLLASIIPFGTFYIDKVYLKNVTTK
jgi:integral membrane protein